MADAGLPFPDGLHDAHAARRGMLVAQASPLSLLVLGAIIACALLGLFGGGTSSEQVARAPAATLAVHTPRTLRSGLFFETRIVIAANRPLQDAIVAIPPSLWRDMTINTTEPQAESEDFKDGSFRFHYGAMKPGDTLEVKFDGQINPPLFAGNRGEITLLDGDTRLTSVPLSIRVLP